MLFIWAPWNSISPGSEPIVLDLEKMFLLSDPVGLITHPNKDMQESTARNMKTHMFPTIFIFLGTHFVGILPWGRSIRSSRAHTPQKSTDNHIPDMLWLEVFLIFICTFYVLTSFTILSFTFCFLFLFLFFITVYFFEYFQFCQTHFLNLFNMFFPAGCLLQVFDKFLYVFRLGRDRQGPIEMQLAVLDPMRYVMINMGQHLPTIRIGQPGVERITSSLLRLSHVSAAAALPGRCGLVT